MIMIRFGDPVYYGGFILLTLNIILLATSSVSEERVAGAFIVIGCFLIIMVLGLILGELENIHDTLKGRKEL